jgi:hypothetical protein
MGGILREYVVAAATTAIVAAAEDSSSTVEMMMSRPQSLSFHEQTTSHADLPAYADAIGPRRCVGCGSVALVAHNTTIITYPPPKMGQK